MNITARTDRRIDFAHAILFAVLMILFGDHLRERVPWLGEGLVHRVISYAITCAVVTLLFVLPTLYLRRRYLKVDPGAGDDS